MTLITIVLLMNLKLNVINEFNKNYKYRGTKLWIINLKLTLLILLTFCY